MINYSNQRLLLPETIWLEMEHYERANRISNCSTSETTNWQIYLDLLALFALETWLVERLPSQKITPHIDASQQRFYLQVGEFTISAIAVENLLAEMVRVSTLQIENHITHFYALLEINEEGEEAIFRGLLRRDHLDANLRANQSFKITNEDYSLPLSWFDPEPNHLLSYCQYLTPEAIALPKTQISSLPSTQPTETTIRTKLTQWLEDTAIEGWSAIETLINPQINLAFSTRSVAQEYQKGKLINLGVTLDNLTMALLVTVKEEEADKLGVRIQLYPTSKNRYLPAQVQLTLLSKAGKILQSVQARAKDNYIQLKPFKGQPGKLFSIEIALEDARVRENFEL